MQVDRRVYLFQRYFNKTATPQEHEELKEWISQDESAEEVRKLMEEAWEGFQGDGIIFTEKQSEAMLGAILQKDGMQDEIKESAFSGRKLHNVRRVLASILLALFITTGYIWLSSRHHDIPAAEATSQLANDIAPGSNRATLTLSNGSVVFLDSVPNGSLVRQGNTRLIKLNNGVLAYKKQRGLTHRQPAVRTARYEDAPYNTITTPRGGQYTVILPDGSEVWLNAASSLRFPAAFTGKTRKVELAGEAYFEVAKDKDKPFYVDVSTSDPNRNITIKVLGTNFDIKAYHDEPVIKTTLLKGSVKVVHGKQTEVLHPSEQAQILQGSDDIRVSRTNVEDIVAWKNGFFHFNGDDIGAIMRKLERWYDVTVIYEGPPPSGHYTGIINRQTNLSQVLKMLALSGVHFKLQGRKIIVTS